MQSLLGMTVRIKTDGTTRKLISHSMFPDATSGIKNASYTITSKTGDVIGKEDRTITFDGLKTGDKTATGKIRDTNGGRTFYDYEDLIVKVLVYDLAGNVKKIESSVNVDTTAPDASVVLNKKTKGKEDKQLL